MEHRIDLDVLADRLQPTMDGWKHRATVSRLTWRDEASAWPQAITPDRSTVQVPESLGFTVQEHGSDYVLQTVVWTGGWVDVGYLIDDEVYTFTPVFNDVEEVYEAVVKDVEEFIATSA
ncbi:hypothetical protein ACFQHV_15575 [Promicromonospora thailandica]